MSVLDEECWFCRATAEAYLLQAMLECSVPHERALFEPVQGLVELVDSVSSVRVPLWLTDIERAVKLAVEKGILDVSLPDVILPGGCYGEEAANSDDAAYWSVCIAVVNARLLNKSFGHQAGFVDVVASFPPFLLEDPTGANGADCWR